MYAGFRSMSPTCLRARVRARGRARVHCVLRRARARSRLSPVFFRHILTVAKSINMLNCGRRPYLHNVTINARVSAHNVGRRPQWFDSRRRIRRTPPVKVVNNGERGPWRAPTADGVAPPTRHRRPTTDGFDQGVVPR